MNKELLLKYINGSATAAESDEVLKWIDASEDNEKYYVSLLNASAVQDVADGTAPSMADGIDVEKAMRKVMDEGGNEDKPKVRRSPFLRVLEVAAVVALAVSVLLNIRQQQTIKSQAAKVALAEPVAAVVHTYYTENGVKGRIVLPDSSVVWLNSGSRITYPEKFALAERDVEFEGEGYFEVTRNPEWPMVVKTTKGMEIKVLGTKFSIKAYSDDDFQEATLFQGKITVTNTQLGKTGARQEALTMVPGQSVTFGKTNVPGLQPKADTTRSIAWKRGELQFDHTPFKEVCKTLQRWHGMEISVTDPSLDDYTFTADLGQESMVQIMELVKYTMPVDYKIDGNKVIISRRNL